MSDFFFALIMPCYYYDRNIIPFVQSHFILCNTVLGSSRYLINIYFTLTNEELVRTLALEELLDIRTDPGLPPPPI